MSSVAVVAMDIHKLFSRCVGLSADSRVVADWRVDHLMPGEMARFFSGFPAGTDVVMEATFNWPWIADLATEAGLKAHLAHPATARKMAKSLSKTDRKDAVWLGKLFLAGPIFPAAYLAPQETRDMRSLFRQRLVVVNMRTKMKNAVHGQLFRLGIITEKKASDLFGVKGREFLAGLELTEHERHLLDRKLKVIDRLSVEIRHLGAVLIKRLKKDSRAGIVMSIPGVGAITAYSVLAEIGTIERFHDKRAVAAYAGVLPIDRESAGKAKDERTARRCNRFLKWALLEAVSGAIKGSARMRGLYERVKSRNKKCRGKARVAVARQLAETIYLLLKRNQMYREDYSASAQQSPNQASQDTLCVGSR